jgi:benzoyl-CoA reductase/2-hydroxyglutaryl-CoA dehydratase subunit BcrC/BadD/HgdB
MLPHDFDDFTEARRDGFIEIKKMKDQGRKVAGIYCAFTPHEIVSAAGAVPVSLCGTSEEPIAEAEKVLPRNLCPLIKSSFGHAISDTCPYFYFSDIVIGETTCDGKKKMYEEIGKFKPLHMMHLPKTQFGDNSFEIMKHEIIRLKERMEEFFEVTITDEDLRREIRHYNRERTALKSFYELGKLMPPPLTGTDIQKVLDGGDFLFERDELISSLERMTSEAMTDYKSGKSKVSPNARRIMITGCPIGGITEKVLGVIEGAGAVVTAFENCGAIRTTDELVDETIDPIDALARKYLNTGCACMSPNDNRLRLIERIMDEYSIDGVVDVVLQACHTFNVETERVRRLVRDVKGKPYITIETDYSTSDTGQLKTRLEAFIEMLG